MKYYLSISIIILFLETCIFDPTNSDNSEYLNVPKDYSTIQEAINAAVEGDTILVERGIYYENINFNGKNITLASKFILDENEGHISNTIIDGSKKASVVTFENGETEEAMLIGFTIQNGKVLQNNSTYRSGGGIYCSNTILRIKNCVIKNNVAEWEGGGIYLTENSDVEIFDSRITSNQIESYYPTSETDDSKWGAGIAARSSDLYLSGVSIHDNIINHYQGQGAGIKLDDTNIIFDENDRCNVYNNKISFTSGYNGSDLDFSWWSLNINSINAYFDTFTVLIPTEYYVRPIEIFNFDILNSYLNIPQLQSDYYVNPILGDNSNVGDTPDNPLKNISRILNNLTLSASDSITIHLANGTYSPSINGEQYPLNIKNNILIIGESEENVIIKPEKTAVAFKINNSKNCLISNLTIKDGGNYWSYGGGLSIINSSLISLINISISDCISHSGYGPTGGGMVISDSDCMLDSVKVINNQSGGLYLTDSKLYMTNSLISNNSSDEAGCGIISGNSIIDLKNTEISGNSAYYHSAINSSEDRLSLKNILIIDNLSSSVGISNTDATFNNCTISRNILNPYYEDENASDINLIKSNATFNNTIIWNVNTQNLSFLDWGFGGTSDITVSFSLINGGQESIYNSGNGTINWLDGNIDTDPLFVDPENGDFHLQPGSPCINAGNPNPEYNDPDGSRNDMGAYGGPGGNW